MRLISPLRLPPEGNIKILEISENNAKCLAGIAVFGGGIRCCARSATSLPTPNISPIPSKTDGLDKLYMYMCRATGGDRCSGGKAMIAAIFQWNWVVGEKHPPRWEIDPPFAWAAVNRLDLLRAGSDIASGPLMAFPPLLVADSLDENYLVK